MKSISSVTVWSVLCYLYLLSKVTLIPMIISVGIDTSGHKQRHCLQMCYNLGDGQYGVPAIILLSVSLLVWRIMALISTNILTYLLLSCTDRQFYYYHLIMCTNVGTRELFPSIA